MLWLILLLIEGLVIGVLGKLVAPGRNRTPLWLTVLIGIAGAIAGNILSNVLGVRHTGGVDWIRHLLQVGAAAVLVSVAAPGYGRRR